MKFIKGINSLIFRTGLYTLISFGLSMMLMIALFIWIADRQIQDLISKENEEHIYTLVQQFDKSIERYLRDIRQNSLSSSLLKAVMNPEDTRYYLPDFLEELNMEDIAGEYYLLTFDGLVIGSSNNSVTDEFFVYYDTIVNDEDSQVHYLGLSNEVIFTAPIHYQGYTEGYFVYLTDFSAIFKSNQHLFELQGDNSRSFSALYNDNVIVDCGDTQEKYIRSIYPLSTLPIHLQVLTNTDIIHDPVKKILVQIVLFSLLTTIFVSLLSSFITSRNLTKPLSDLEKGITEVGNGNLEHISEINRESIEVRFIRESFNSIQRDVTEKARDLEYSNNKLKEINENLQNTQKQLVQSEKMASIGQLAAGVAHEINNPTGFVTTNLHTMKEYLIVFKGIIDKYDELTSLSCLSDIDEVKTLLREIGLIKEKEDFDFVYSDSTQLIEESIDGVERIRDIVDGLKKFARPDSLTMIMSNINIAIDDALRLTWNELKYNCKVEKDLGTLPFIPCRIDQLTQVFVNLFVNAVHAIHNKGTIYIKSWKDESYIYVSVEDTGEGIPKENLPKLFDPFFTTKEVGKGTGLGLAISYGIIEKHGGTIVVDSTIGTGTSFQISLPINKETI